MPIKQGGMLAKRSHLLLNLVVVERRFDVNLDLENVFCQIDSNSFNVHDSSAPFNE